MYISTLYIGIYRHRPIILPPRSTLRLFLYDHLSPLTASPPPPLGSPPPQIVCEGSQLASYQYVSRTSKPYQSSRGRYTVAKWLGLPYGSRVYSDKKDGWVLLLRPTPEHWSNILSHRTQILYLPDIATVLSFLDLRPGATVLESGTGSASLTHSLARAVAPSGHVHTFEFHEGRANAARTEISKHHLDHLVTVNHRNTELLGWPEEFTYQAEAGSSLRRGVDAVFLDLPHPWRVLQSTFDCLVRWVWWR